MKSEISGVAPAEFIRAAMVHWYCNEMARSLIIPNWALPEKVIPMRGQEDIPVSLDGDDL